MYNLHGKGGLAGGMLAVSPMLKSVSFLRKEKRSTIYSFMIAYLSSVELLGIYRG